MPAHLYVAPAGSGKTHFVLQMVRDSARDLLATPIVCVPSTLQAGSCRRRLAQAGGAIGVRVLTFHELYLACLDEQGAAYGLLRDQEQYRMLSVVVRLLPLQHYASLVDKPGFVRSLQGLIGELKAGRIDPEVLIPAVETIGNEPRLRELAEIYRAYQERLQDVAAADRAGIGWLAAEGLEANSSICRWPLVVIDGFDNLTQIQIDLLKALAPRVRELIITLTGDVDGPARSLVHQRMLATRRRLESELGILAERIPTSSAPHSATLAHLRDGLYEASVGQGQGTDAVSLIEAPDRAGEVREALRWLKARVLEDHAAVSELALLARRLAPYRGCLPQIAREFSVPIRIVGGLPLATNPAIAALLDLIRLLLPEGDGGEGPSLTRRLVVEAWRSPYFDWDSLGISDSDADRLDIAARWGRVIGGYSQWEETLDRLSALSAAEERDEERDTPGNLPRGELAVQIGDKFRGFVQRLMPSRTRATYRDHVSWLESLIGDDPHAQGETTEPADDPMSLRMVECAREGEDGGAELDLVALRCLKEVLRGFVWAEEVLRGGHDITFSQFGRELFGAVEATLYELPSHPERPGILVADVTQARGVPFRAVAVVGNAEGEFPAIQNEDPFLRDDDRIILRENHGLALELSTASAEPGYFYETITRPWEKLLLTRPRLAENGVLWQPSPFWQEVRRLVNTEPRPLSSDSVPPIGAVASAAEMMTSLAAHNLLDAAQASLEPYDKPRIDRLRRSARTFATRFGRLRDSVCDGDLSILATHFEAQYGSAHVWSPTRLETYRACPFFFFVGRVLNLEPREEPAEGLDPRQLGSIYHHILEALFKSPLVTDTTDLDGLRAALPVVSEVVLDRAPAEEGFRETAWWRETRQEIVANLERSLEALAEVSEGYRPVAFEAMFGGDAPLTLADGQDRLHLHGFIDRVDRSPDGLRVIDYKTAGPWMYRANTLRDGKKLQIALYALAARDALHLGEPIDGFYWHVRHAEPSGLRLSTYDGGPEGAFGVALGWAWRTVREVRAGHFQPHPPIGGCPRYCPAASFCWQYSSGYGG